MLAAVDCAVILIDAARGVEAADRAALPGRPRARDPAAGVRQQVRPAGHGAAGDARPPERHARALAGADDLARRAPGRLQRRDRPRATGRSTASSASPAAPGSRPSGSSPRAARPTPRRTRRGRSPRRSSRWSTRSAPCSTPSASRAASASRCCSARRPGTSASGCCWTRSATSRRPPSPAPPTTARLRPVDAPFAALAFKVQANMDPRHRDRVAFVRICSGRFERGMRVHQRAHRPQRSRSTTRTRSSARTARCSTRPSRATSSASSSAATCASATRCTRVRRCASRRSRR